MFEYLLTGLATAMSLSVLPIIFFGVLGGIILGALPGLTATMGVAILLPFTFGMEATPALVMLIGVYIGMVLFTQVIYPFLVVLAIVDSVFDFRGLKQQKNDA